MNPFETYLQRVARELRPLPLAKREEELHELRSHLEQRAEDFQGQGLDSKDAQTRTVEVFGSPRALGAQLCDAWEGIPFSWWRVGASVLRVTMLLFATALIFAIAMGVCDLFPETGLFPEAIPLCIGFYALVPFGCGWLFSRWLGRRGRLIALLYFGILYWGLNFGLSYNTSNPNATLGAPDLAISFVDASWLPTFDVALGCLGAVTAYAYKSRLHLHLALAGGQSVNARSTRVGFVPLNLKTWARAAGFVLTVALFFAFRAWSVTHPTTPTATFRNWLIINRGGNSGDFEAPIVLGMQELPPQTPAERAGLERRVKFQVEARMTSNYRARRLAWLQRLIASPVGHKDYGIRPLRLSIARIKRNSHIIRGTARLVKTPKGWEVDGGSFGTEQLWAWAEDIYFER